MRHRTTMLILRAGASALVLASCSGSFSIGGVSPEEAAVKLIESEIAEQLGVDTLEATCDDVKDPEIGSEFACTATTDDGRVVRLTTVIDREDHIDVTTENALGPADLERIEANGIQLIGEQFGVDLDADLMDCGDEVVILPDDLVLVCAFSEPDSTDVYDATYEITDLDTGAFNIKIAETPRG